MTTKMSLAIIGILFSPSSVSVGSGGVIKGWDQGLPYFKVGSKGVLFIPHELAYGVAGSPPRIPPKSELMFYIEITEAN